MRHVKCGAAGRSGGRTEAGSARRGGAWAVRALLRRAEWTGAISGAVLAGVTATALGAPEGAQVVRGDVRISRRGGETLIQAGRNSIINYSSFNIGAGEVVRFVQPDSASRVLNRINSAAPTRIDGSLLANGRVYLVNPAGVYFGQGSVINVGGLYAAAATMTDRVFLKGVDRFTNASGSVVNEGQITADFAALVGKHVENNGSIVSPMGTVVMGAGEDVLIGRRGGGVYVRVSGTAGEGMAGAGVSNAGTISTSGGEGRRGGRVVVGVGDVLGTALVNSGRITSKDVRLEGQGRGVVAVGGTVDASDATGRGGRVKVLGEKVALRDAQIDASGAVGGGEVAIGGTFHGAGADRNADRTFVSGGTTIHADATASGDGGRVVVWSEQATAYNGSITAKGATGKGGTVEVSGKQSLAFNGRGDVSSASGRDGTILLDPRDITIQQTAGADDGQVADEQVLFNDGPPPADFVIGEAALEALTGNVVLQATRHITVNAGVTLDMNNQTAGESVLFQAGGNITIGGTITTGGGMIDLRAGDNGAGTALGTAALTINAALNSAGGDIRLSTTGSGGIGLNANVTAGAGNIRLTGGTGGATQGAGAITGAGLELLGGGSFTLTQAGNNVATLAGNTTGPISYTDTDTLAIGTVTTVGLTTAGDDIVITTGGTLTLNQNVAAGAGNVTLAPGAGGVSQLGGNLTASGLRLLGAGTFDLNSAGNNVTTLAGNVNGAVSYTDANTLTIGNVVSSGLNSGGNAIVLNTGGALTLAQTVTATGATITLNPTAGGVNQTGGSLLAANLRLLGAGTFTLTSATNDVDVIAGNVNGAVNFVDADDVAVGTAVTVGLTTGGNAATLRAGTNITVGSALNAGAGAVTLLADDMAINAAVTGNGGIAIAPTTGGRSIGLGGAAGGLNFSATELANLASTGTVTIGNAASGAITAQTLAFGSAGFDLWLHGASITVGATTLNTGKTLTLQAVTGGATETATITATNLRLLGAGTFNLSDPGNHFGVVAGNVNGATSIGDADGFTVGTVTDNGLTIAGPNGLFLLSGGPVTIAQNITTDPGARVTLFSTGGGYTQTTGAISTTDLRLGGTGAFTLTNAANDAATIAGNVNGAVSYRDANAVTVGIVSDVGIASGGGNVALQTGGLLTLGQGINAGAGSVTLNSGAGATQSGVGITAAGLELLGSGPYSLLGDNHVATLAGVVAGDVRFNNLDALSVGTVNTIGLTATNDITLTAGLGITVAQAINATRAVTLGTNVIDVAANVSAGAGGIDIHPLTAGTAIGLGTITAGLDLSAAELGRLASAGGVTIGSANAGTITTSALDLSGTTNYDLTLRGFSISTAGLRIGATRTLTFDSLDGATQTGAISAHGLRLLGTGDFLLENGLNDVDVIAGTASGRVSFRDADDLEVGSLAGTNGLTVLTDRSLALRTGGALLLTQNLSSTQNLVSLNVAAGGVQQTGGSIFAHDLLLLGAGAFTLTSATNDVTTLAANVTGGVSYRDANAFSVGSAGGTDGVTTTGATTLRSGGVLTLTQAVNTGTNSLTLNASGGAVQAGGRIVAGALEVLGGGPFVLNNASNDVGVLAGNITGDLTYADANDLRIGAAGGSTGLTANQLAIDASGNIGVLHNIAAPVGVFMHAGTDGTGDLAFLAPGANVDSAIINLRAGDGVGGGGSASLVDAVTNAPTFHGSGGGATRPTAFTIRQDWQIFDTASLPLASQFGGGVLTGIGYNLISDEGEVFLATGSRLTDAFLTLQGANGVRMNGVFDPASLVTHSILTLDGTIRARSSDVILDAVTLTGSSSIGAGPLATLTLNQGVNAGTHNLTLEGDEIEILGALIGSGVLTIQPVTHLQWISLGTNIQDANLDLSNAELAQIQNGWLEVAIGRAGDASRIFIESPMEFRDNIRFRPGDIGAVVINNPIRLTDTASMRIEGAAWLNANITSAQLPVFIDGPITLGANVVIDTTDGGANPLGQDVILGGAIDADSAANDRTLTILAGTGGAARIGGAAGAAQELASIFMTGGSLGVNAVRTKHFQQYNGNTTVGGDLTTTVVGAIGIAGDLVLAGDSTFHTAGLDAADDISITGTINSQVSGSERRLTLEAGLGDIALTAAGGGTTALSSFSATGASILSSGMKALGAVAFHGPTQIGGEYAGSSISFDDGVGVNTATVFTGTTSLLFGSWVRSQNNSPMTIHAPTVSFSGAVGDIAGTELGSLDITAGTVVLTGGSVRTLGAQVYDSTIALGADTTLVSVNAGVALKQTVNAAGQARALTLSGPGAHALGGDVGTANALSTLSVSGGTLRLGGSTYRTAGVQTYDSDTLLDADAVFTSDTISFRTLNSGANGSKALTINAANGTATLGATGATSDLTSVVITASGITLNSVRTTGLQTYNGPTTLSGNLQSTNDGAISFNGAVALAADVTVQTAGTSPAQNIVFSNAVNSFSAPHSLTATAGQGRVTFSGDVGLGAGVTDAQLANLTVNAANVDVKGVRTTGTQAYSGATTLNGNLSSTQAGAIFLGGATTLAADTTITTTQGDVTFSSTLDSGTATHALTVNSGGNGVTRFRGAVGGTSRLTTLTTNADGVTRFEGGSVRTTGEQRYNDAVTLAADTSFESPTISFASTLDSDNLRTPRGLRVNTAGGTSTGTLTFGGGVGQSFALKSILTDGTGITRVSTNVRTTQGMTYGGVVRLLGSSVMDAGAGSAFFKAAIDTETNFSPAALELRSTQVADGTNTPFRFGGHIGNTAPLASLTLGGDLSAPARAATIVFSDSMNSAGRVQSSGTAATDLFVINTTGDFTMGLGQKLLSFGRLQIKSGGTARLGDLTSFADIRVEANAIRLRLRPAGQLVDNVFQGPADQFVGDSGLDFVAAGAIDFNHVPTVEGTGGPVAFANSAGAVGANLQGFTVRQYPGGIKRALWDDPRSGNSGLLLALDLKADGPSTAQLATSLAGAIPRDPQTSGSIVSPAAVSASLLDPLQEMGIATRDLSADEAIEFLVGRSIYRDAPGKASPSREDYRVSINRLSAPSVQRALSSYRSLVFQRAMNPDGTPQLDAQGRPVLLKQSSRIKETIAQAWDSYTEKVRQPDGVGFRAYLETRLSAASTVERDALGYLMRTREVLDSMDGLGLSPFETSIPKAKLLNSLRPGGMTDAQLRDAVYGAARVRQ